MGDVTEYRKRVKLTELPDPSPEMAIAVRKLVRLKDAWDDALRMPKLRELVPAEILSFNERCVDGRTFVRRVLPFLDDQADCGQSVLAPIDRTIGTPWSWRECTHNSPRTPAELQALLLDPARADADDHLVADMIHISPFGLYVANEGKNRVRFLRDRGVAAFPAWVNTIRYPDAARVALYRVEVAGREEMWAVLDGRWVERLLLPGVTTPLLAACGVARPTYWPGLGWPRPIEVAQAMEVAARAVTNRGRVDLHEILARREQEIEGQRWVAAMPLMIEDTRVRWSWWGWVASALALSAGLTWLLPSGVQAPVWSGLAGIAGGLVVGVLGSNLWVRHKLLTGGGIGRVGTAPDQTPRG